MSGVGFGHFDSGYLTLGPAARWKYFAQFLLETLLETNFYGIDFTMLHF